MNLYEKRGEEPISTRAFFWRVLGHFLVAFAMLAASLGIGMAGYEYFEGLAWLDAFENSAMLLGGMGPVDNPVTDGGKLFAGLYALYCGLLFLVVLAIVIAPVVHRILHHFHWDETD